MLIFVRWKTVHLHLQLIFYSGSLSWVNSHLKQKMEVVYCWTMTIWHYLFYILISLDYLFWQGCVVFGKISEFRNRGVCLTKLLPKFIVILSTFLKKCFKKTIFFLVSVHSISIRMNFIQVQVLRFLLEDKKKKRFNERMFLLLEF